MQAETSPDIVQKRCTDQKKRLLIKAGFVAALARGLGAQNASAETRETMTIGVNMFRGVYSTNMDEELDNITRMRSSLIRVFVANHEFSYDQVIEKLKIFLDRTEKRGLQVIACLTDQHQDKGLYPKGTEGFYTPTENGIPTLNHLFFAGGFTNEYLVFVDKVVETFRDHPSIYAWEPGNELRVPENKEMGIKPELLTHFMSSVNGIIALHSPTKFRAAGIVNTQQAGFVDQDHFYGKKAEANITLATIHDYSQQDRISGLVDLMWCKRNGIPMIIEELGVPGADNRSAHYKNALSFWANQGALASLVWGYMTSHYDNGNGDRVYGIDDLWHRRDFKNITQMIRELLKPTRKN